MHTESRNRKPVFTSLLLAIACLAATAVQAQDWKGRGRLQGQVTDSNGAPVPDATVTLLLEGQEGQGPPAEKTNKKGRWAYLGLTTGNWNIVIEAEGFRVAEGTARVVEVAIGAGKPINITLNPLTVEERRADIGTVLDRGNAALEGGDFEGARAAYEEALEVLEPSSHAPVLQGIARTYYQEGNLDQAIATLDQALTLVPDDEATLQLVINLLTAEGREEEAQSYAARLPDDAKLDKDTMLNLGIQRYNENNYDQALEHFDRVVRDYPAEAEAYYYRALAGMGKGNSEQAAADFKKMLELAPDHDKAGEAKQFLDYLEPAQ